MNYTKGEWEAKVLGDGQHIVILAEDKSYQIALCGWGNKANADVNLIASAPIGDKLATAVLDANFDDFDNFLELKELAKKFKIKAEGK